MQAPSIVLQYLPTLKTEYIAFAVSLTLIAGLYLIAKLDKQNRLKQQGLFKLAGEGLAKAVNRIAAESKELIALLFGLDKNEIESLVLNERVANGLVKSAIAIDFFLIAISFFGSFSASRDYALQNGIDAGVAPFVPIAVDGFIGLCVAVIFYGSMVGRSIPLASICLAAFTAVSIHFNVAHIVEVSNSTFAHRLLGAIFPLVIFVGTELLSKLFKLQMARHSQLKTNDDLANEIAAKKAHLQKLDTHLATRQEAIANLSLRFSRRVATKNSPVRQKSDEGEDKYILAKEMVKDLHLADKARAEIVASVTEAYGISARTVDNYLKEMKQKTEAPNKLPLLNGKGA